MSVEDHLAQLIHMVGDVLKEMHNVNARLDRIEARLDRIEARLDSA